MGVVTPKGRTRATIRHSGRLVAEVRTTYLCPVCGSRHEARTDPGLRALRELVRDELVSCVRGHAEEEHVTNVLAVLDDVEARIGA